MEEINPQRFRYLMDKTHLEALLENQRSLKHWESYKADYKDLQSRLSEFPKKLKHSVMVPIGKKALMRGSLVHTNEITVSLGVNWFMKCSSAKAIDVCTRRITKAQELIDKFDKEKNLLESRRNMALDSDIFKTEGTREIIEEFDEEEEKKWRERHRVKEKEYRQKLANLSKEVEQTSIQTYEDLCKRLDALDLQEELEDELNRLSCSSQSDEVESNSESGSAIDAIKEEEEEEEEESDTEPVRIHFKHSEQNLPPKQSSSVGIIQSPTDIYKMFTCPSTDKVPVLENVVEREVRDGVASLPTKKTTRGVSAFKKSRDASKK